MEEENKNNRNTTEGIEIMIAMGQIQYIGSFAV